MLDTWRSLIAAAVVVLRRTRASNRLMAKRKAASALDGPSKQSKSSDTDATVDVVMIDASDEYLDFQSEN